MASAETDAKAGRLANASSTPAVKVRPRKSESALDKVLGLLSSVKLGVTLLMVLLTCCIIGMVIMQQDVENFQTYYAKLLPAQKLVFGGLGFFGIYHSWYFELLLAITGLNIILASIDRFPTAWQYVSKPKRKASASFIRAQMFNSEMELNQQPHALALQIKSAWRRRGLRGVTISEEKGRITVFGQRNVWNRLGAYFVHVALLTIFTGGFLTTRYGVGGMMDIVPGNTGDRIRTVKVDLDGQKVGSAQLPFSIECTDLQQKLVDPNGGLQPNNTVDWLSYIKIIDRSADSGAVDALVHLNKPLDYRGYRFFQSSFNPIGYARSIVVSLVPVSGGQSQDVKIDRNAATDVPGIGKMSYSQFFPAFQIGEDGKPETASPEYLNPVAILRVDLPDGSRKGTFAYNAAGADKFYAQMGSNADELLLNGNRVILKEFEKVPTWHTLAVQYDPGRRPVYVGFAGLLVALCSVFFFAHQRMWAVIEPDGHKSKVYIGGNTNRNRGAFEPRFGSFVELATGRRAQTNE